MFIVSACFLIIIICGLAYHILTLRKKLAKFSELIPVSEQKFTIEQECQRLKQKIKEESENFSNEKDSHKSTLIKLDTEIGNKKLEISKLEKTVSALSEAEELIEAGFYTPRYKFLTSEEYAENLEDIRFRLKTLIQCKDAIKCDIPWTVNGSKTEGTKMINQAIRLGLSSYNGQVDNIILSVSYKNIATCEEKINKIKSSVEKMLQVNQCYINQEYHDLKMQELRLAYEYEEKLYEEKEEQKRVRLQMQEEERERKAIEKAKDEAEKEEKECIKELVKAKKELEKSHDEERSSLLKVITELEDKLKLATEKKERAISMAEQTKRGHVYIISNIGSFGENVFKIGLTRRIFPQERVDELGDASVPFEFDVHGMIYCENAPELERKLHVHFDQSRMNKINSRKEFFRTTIEEIEVACQQLGHEIELLKVADAREYRQSCDMKEIKKAA